MYTEYKIEKYITNRALRRNIKQQKLLFEYIRENNIDFLVKDNKENLKLNPIINISNTELKEKYHIDLKQIEKLKRLERATKDSSVQKCDEAEEKLNQLIHNKEEKNNSKE